MEQLKKNVTRGILLVLLLLFFSCGENKISPPYEKELHMVDSILASYSSTLYTNPIVVNKELAILQKQLTDSIGWYKLQLYRGCCYYLNNQTDSAFNLNKTVLDYCTREKIISESLSGKLSLEALAWEHRAVFLQQINKRDSALVCLEKAYTLLSRTDGKREMLNLCVNIADTYRQKGDLPNSSKYYHCALAIADSIGTSDLIFCIYAGLGQVYSDLANFTQSEHYFLLAEQNLDKSQPYEQFYFYNSRGNKYYSEKKYPDALEWFRKAQNLSYSFQQSTYEATIEANLGEIFILLGQSDSARYYLDRSYAIFSKEPENNADALFYLNSLYATLALYTNNLIEAGRYLSKPYDLRQIGPYYNYLHNKRLMEYYEKTGDFKQAYMYRTKVDLYDDSLRNVRNQNNIREIDYRYRQDTILLKRDVIIATNKSRMSRMQIIIVVCLALLLALSLAAFGIIAWMRWKSERKYNRQRETLIKLRMENVRNRISPHYMFNVLNVILPALRPYREVSNILQMLINALRGNLLVSEKIAVELGQEMELVKNDVNLRRSMNPEIPEILWDVSSNVSLSTWIPSMIIQIPIENALKYAFNPESKEKAYLSVKIKLVNQGISILIEDNGEGYTPGKQGNSIRGTGTGLKVLYSTIELLNRKNIDKILFNIYNLAFENPTLHGTKVNIYIPFNYNFNL